MLRTSQLVPKPLGLFLELGLIDELLLEQRNPLETLAVPRLKVLQR